MGVFPSDRLQTISEYLDIPYDKILFPDGSKVQNSGHKKEYYINEETAMIAQKVFENEQLRMLINEAVDADPEDIQTAYAMLMALKRKEKHID